MLFRSYCISVYMTQLCGQFIMLVLIVNLLHAIIVVLKLSLVLHDVTQILFNIGLPSFNTVLRNCKAIFMRTWLNSSNSIVSHVRRI